MVAKVYSALVFNLNFKLDCHYSCSTCYGPKMNNCLTCKDNSDNFQTINRDMKFS